MAIARPVTKTIISSTAFGIPVADFVNANTPTPWVNASYLNGWTTADTRPAQYCKVGPVVYLRGVVSGGTLGMSVFLLPQGHTPVNGTDFAVICGPSATHGALSITQSGNVIPYVGFNSGFHLTCQFVVI